VPKELNSAIILAAFIQTPDFAGFAGVLTFPDSENVFRPKPAI
jgi:hypothetical protein